MFSRRKTRPTFRCSFCSKQQDQVERLIAGPNGVYICDQCVELCQKIIESRRETPGTSLGEESRAARPRGEHV